MAFEALRLKLLGCWEFSRSGRLVNVAAGELRLVAFLALTGQRNRTHMGERLWPEYRSSVRAPTCARFSGGCCTGTAVSGHSSTSSDEAVALSHDVAVALHEFVSCAAKMHRRPELAVDEVVLSWVTA